jgi:asparagine synthetase B (glutamine-hydrolysing)
MFIASTSQRAIIYFLESFEPDNAAFLWMLSSGSLGPGYSWDRRIKFLNPDTRLRLDRRTWRATVEKGEVDFHCTGRTEQEYERDLREALEYSFAGLSLDYSKWALALSGGYDSRAILLKLKEHRDLQCITCGMRSELSDKESDAFIARQLAGNFGLPHRYFELEPSDEDLYPQQKAGPIIYITAWTACKCGSHCLTPIFRE